MNTKGSEVIFPLNGILLSLDSIINAKFIKINSFVIKIMTFKTVHNIYFECDV